MSKRILLMTLALMLVATACGGQGGGAAKLLPDLPNLPNVKVVEGQTITEYITTLVGGQALLTGNPIIAAALKFAEGAVKCYQDIGAVAVRVYSDQSNPLSSGMVAIIDRNAITDLGNAARCLTGGDQAGAQSLIQICVRSYTLKKEDNEFYIAYLATTDTLCNALCNALEGCPDKQP